MPERDFSSNFTIDFVSLLSTGQSSVLTQDKVIPSTTDNGVLGHLGTFNVRCVMGIQIGVKGGVCVWWGVVEGGELTVMVS